MEEGKKLTSEEIEKLISEIKEIFNKSLERTYLITPLKEKLSGILDAKKIEFIILSDDDSEVNFKKIIKEIRRINEKNNCFSGKIKLISIFLFGISIIFVLLLFTFNVSIDLGKSVAKNQVSNLENLDSESYFEKNRDIELEAEIDNEIENGIDSMSVSIIKIFIPITTTVSVTVSVIINNNEKNLYDDKYNFPAGVYTNGEVRISISNQGIITDDSDRELDCEKIQGNDGCVVRDVHLNRSYVFLPFTDKKLESIVIYVYPQKSYRMLIQGIDPGKPIKHFVLKKFV